MRIKLLLLTIFTVLLTACPGGSDWSGVSNGTVPISDDSQQITPKGVEVLGKKAITPTQLALVEAGVAEAFDGAMKSGYDKGLEFSHYRVWTPDKPCQLSPEQHVPSFQVRADNYDGSIWDQYNPKGAGVRDGIGVVFAAEMVRSVGTPGSNPPKGEIIVCPSDQYIQDAVKFGLEHILAAANHPEYYTLTLTHTCYFHPLLPEKSEPDIPCLESKLTGTHQESFIIEPVK